MTDVAGPLPYGGSGRFRSQSNLPNPKRPSAVILEKQLPTSRLPIPDPRVTPRIRSQPERFGGVTKAYEYLTIRQSFRVRAQEFGTMPDNSPRQAIEVSSRVFGVYGIRTNFTFNIPTLVLGRPDSNISSPLILRPAIHFPFS